VRASLDDVDWVAAARSVVDQGWARRRSALARDACARLLDAARDARVADPDGELTPRKSTSLGSPGTDARTRRSAHSSISALAPSNGTCERCSPSWGSAHARASRKLYRPVSTLPTLQGDTLVLPPGLRLPRPAPRAFVDQPAGDPPCRVSGRSRPLWSSKTRCADENATSLWVAIRQHAPWGASSPMTSNMPSAQP
jgi:hypothetical protein